MQGSETVEQPEGTRPGDVLAGKYHIESVIGAGGMGVIVAARHLQLGQRVAIKLLTRSAAENATSATRFLREAQNAAGLRSDHVVRIYDVGTLPSGEPFMVMELLDGVDLAVLLRESGPLSIEDAVEYVLQASNAIAEAHAAGIIHRDLKPANLFLTGRSDGTACVKVLDFGISKAGLTTTSGGEDGSLTATSGIIGSPLYMSPEQVRDARHVDARSDIWSLGIILYELLSGLPAFNAQTLTGICAAITADDPAPLGELRTGLPPELVAVVHRCLEKKPALRFQAVEDLVEALLVFRPLSASGAQALQRSGKAVVGAQASARISGEGALVRGTDSTMPAPADLLPTLPGPTAKLAASDSPTVLSAANTQPTADSPRQRSLRHALGIGAAIAAAALLAATLIMRSHGEPTALPPPVAAPTKSFKLIIDSTPQGATVREGERDLGRTPLELSIEAASVAAHARRFEIQLDGYRPYTLMQEASDKPVRVVAPLAPVPVAPAALSAPPLAAAAPAAPATRDRAPPAKPVSAPPTASKPTGLDIRMQR